MFIVCNGKSIIKLTWRINMTSSESVSRTRSILDLVFQSCAYFAVPICVPIVPLIKYGTGMSDIRSVFEVELCWENFHLIVNLKKPLGKYN